VLAFVAREAREVIRMPALQILWKTLLFGAVALIFRGVEEIVPLQLARAMGTQKVKDTLFGPGSR
jgi:hypothetical protein